MEQIQRAVARAKALRDSTSTDSDDHQPKHTRAYSGAAQAAAPSSPVETAPEDLSKIVYTYTRKFSPDQTLLRERRLVAQLANDPAGATFRVLRSQILQKVRQHDVKALAILGPTPGVGKSMVAANLAVAISRETNQTVLLADLDLRKPRAAWYFGIEPELGIADYLSGDAEISEILVNPGFERLVVLPGSEVIEDTSEVLTSTRMLELLEEMKTRYTSRIVLIDLPPLLATDDALSMLPYLDAGLLVLEEGTSTAEEVEECMRLLGDTRLLGTVVNKASVKSNASYYGYNAA